MSAVIRAGALRSYRELVRELGADPKPLLRSCKIKARMLDDEDTLIPLRAQVRLLEISAQTLRLYDFGMRLGHRQDIAILGPLAMAMQHAPTAGEALRCASQWLFVQSQAVDFSVVAHGTRPADPVELRFDFSRSPLGPARQFMDQCLAVLNRITAFLAPDAYRPLYVSLDHSPLVPLHAYRRVFGAPVRAAQPHAALFIERRFLDAPLRNVNAVLRKMAFDYLDERFGHREDSVSARVRLVLARSMGVGGASREIVAQNMAMHPRTLLRHLAQEGTCFEAVRDGVRKDIALRYLRTSHLSMTQIAAVLGLSQSSVLTRCCLRWFGRTPSALRLAGPAAREPRLLGKH